MSEVIRVRLRCDECGKFQPGCRCIEKPADNITTARDHAARHLGWSMLDGQDLCRTCTQNVGGPHDRRAVS